MSGGLLMFRNPPEILFWTRMGACFATKVYSVVFGKRDSLRQ